MDRSDQSSSEQHQHIFSKAMDWIGVPISFLNRVLGLRKAIVSFLPSKKSSPNIGSSSNGWFNKMMYRVVVVTGIAAVWVSGTIEYEVMTEVYNAETDITNLPIRGWNFGKKVFFGKQVPVTPIPTQGDNPQVPAPKLDEQIPPDQILEQEDIPRKSKSWIPLLFVLAVEGMKCSLIYYRHSRTEISRQLSSTFLRGVLIFLSFSCTLIFLATLMNKPYEDKVNNEIAKATREINEAMKKDERLLELQSTKKRIEKALEDRKRDVLEEIQHGGNGRRAGPGRVARALERLVAKEKNDLKEIEEKIKSLWKDIEKDAANKIKEKENQIRKGGRALDPKWMSNVLSAVHETFYPNGDGNYPRRLATIFIMLFSLLMSFALEYIIIEAFKRLGKENTSNQFWDGSDFDSSQTET